MSARPVLGFEVGASFIRKRFWFSLPPWVNGTKHALQRIFGRKIGSRQRATISDITTSEAIIITLACNEGIHIYRGEWGWVTPAVPFHPAAWASISFKILSLARNVPLKAK